MRKSRIIVFLVVAALLNIVFTAGALAQVAPPTGTPATSSPSTPGEKPKTWACLETSAYNPLKDSRHIRPGGKIRHIIEGKASGLPSDRCIYIVGCIHTPNNIECTTGSSEFDRLLRLVHFSSDGTEIPNAVHMRTSAKDPKPYTFYVDGGPERCNLTNGELDAIAFSESLKDTTHSLFAVYFTDIDSEVTDDSGTASTLKYSQFGFGSSPAACGGQRWDPYGTVFDAQSLEPLPAAVISLLDRNKSKVVLPGLANPISTKADGLFNFLPEPGIYMLQPSKSGYIFATSQQIHPNFQKAYSELYLENDDIVEKAGAQEHRDVPLVSSGAPFRSDPVHINFGVSQVGTQLSIAGKQSHPLTHVVLKQDGTDIARTEADKYGYYQFTLANTILRPDALLEVYFQKVDLTKDTASGPAKKAYHTNPVPPFIEGKAYDTQGNTLPNALVRIKLDMTGSVYTETTADNEGIFAVMPNALPPFPYSLEYVPNNTSLPIKKSVVDFARENKDYFSAYNVSIMAATKNGRPLITQKPITPTPASAPEPERQSPKNIKTIILLLFTMVLLGILGLFYYLRTQKTITIEDDTLP